jgi:hypothetical protein
MSEYEYAKFESEHFDQLAKEFDWVCEQRLKSINQYLSNEKPPYPPPHTVTLARAVHVLAMRTLADEHPAKYPGYISYTSKGRRGLHLYWLTVFRINDGVNLAAQKGTLRLRDGLTGFPIQNWHIPSTVEFAEWERCAIFPNDHRQTADRQAIEIMSTFKWPLLAPHFYTSVVASLVELDAWAAGIGIVEAGGLMALLQTIEAKAAERARDAAAADAADERGERFDPSKFALGQQQTVPTPAPVEAVGASGGVEPDKAGLVDKGWVMKKAALMDKHADKWKTIKGDFHSASENGLSKAAKAPGHGEWFEAGALNWAEQRGKLEKGEEQGPNNLATVWTGKKHTIQG